MTTIACIQYVDYNNSLICEEDLGKFICSAMLPIMKRSTQIYPDANTKRDTYESLYGNIMEIIRWREVVNRKEALAHMKAVKMDAENATQAEKTEAKNSYLKYRKNVLSKEYSVNLFLDWVIKYIYKQMTQDIYPFNDEFMYTAEQHASRTLYNKIMTTWYTFGYIIFTIDEKCNTLSGYSELIKCTTRNFVKANTAISNHLYIYNVNQSSALYGYPYNQWIEDVNDNIVVSWYRNIYDNYIVNNMSSLSSEGISYSLFAQVLIASLSQSVNDVLTPRDIINMTKKVNSYALDLKSIYMNIEQYAKSRDNINVIDTASAPIFPCQNGIIKFNEDGTYVFSTDNYDCIYTGYTNTMYYNPKTYNKECEAYKTITETLQQIMPDDEQRDYVLSVLSCVLHGIGNRDLFTILKGSGADGKTTLCNIILAMLGAPGFEPSAGPGVKQLRKNPGGLADSISAEVILKTNALPSSHQSGGIIKLKGKRFIITQEPDSDGGISTVKSSIIKDITSGSTTTAREIREKAVTFTIKVIMILQLNNDLRLTENDPAMARRLKVVNMISKFYQPSTQKEFELKRYKFKADPTLNDRIRNDPSYWEAMLQILLPYALKVLKDYKGTPSNIPTPERIDNDTKAVLGVSYGMDEVITKQVEYAPNMCIPFYGLLRKVYDNGFTDIRKRPLEQTVKFRIGAKYINHIVKVKDEEYMDKVINRGPIGSHRPYLCENDRMIEEDGEWKVIRKTLSYIYDSESGLHKSYSLDDIKLEKYAVHALSESNDIDYKDLFIVGYKFTNEVSPVNIF